ncbi:MAG: hypothetical protein ACRCWD_06335 [Culicoidibacterales bacterium]
MLATFPLVLEAAVDDEIGQSDSHEQAQSGHKGQNHDESVKGEQHDYLSKY